MEKHLQTEAETFTVEEYKVESDIIYLAKFKQKGKHNSKAQQ
jgi:hypothetical protein